jgi:hypothetical protein
VVAGHFGFAALVKSRERQVPLWALMLACQWMDVVFIPLYLGGVERIVPAPGESGAFAQIIYADYTHSLVGALALAVGFGWLAGLRWGRRSGLVLGLVVFSHWLLDLLVHRRDMPLLPGNAGGLPRLGFGLWRFPAASVALELALVVAGALLYGRAAARAATAAGVAATRARVAGGVALLAGVATLVLNALGM